MNARAPLLVGMVLLIATVGLTWFVLTTSKDKFGEDATYPLYADFTDAAGISPKTRLQINGIDVGKVEEIKHVRNADGRLVARVTLRILKEYDVYKNAVLRKAAESLLGDFRLDLDPGTPATPKLPPEGIIPNVQSRSDLDEIQAQLKQVASNVNNVTESFSRVLSGPEGEGSLKEILDSVNRSMDAIEATTAVLADMVTRNDRVIDGMIVDLGKFSNAIATATGPGGDVKQLTENLNRLASRLDRIAGSIDNLVGDESVPESERGQLRETFQNVNESIGHLNNIAKKIDDGQGTLGRVVNDPGLIDKIEQTVDDAQELIGSLSRMETQIELRTQYEVPWQSNNEEIQAGMKNILGLRIVPRPDKYYLIEAISDPRGTATRKITSTTSNGVTTKLEEQEISFDTLKFSAQFAKRYYFLTMRFGIIENTGGVGLNFHALEDRVELRLDAFDFTRRDPDANRPVNPRFRSTAMLEFVDHLFLQGGIDDPFNAKLRTWFIGGALRFTDEDLKALLTVAPAPPG